MIVLILFLQGCGGKKTELQPPGIEIPSYFFAEPKIDINREIETQTQTAIFLLDLYEAYEKCTMNLRSIKKLVDKAKKDKENVDN